MHKKRNKARVGIMNGLMPVTDWKLYNKDKQIYQALALDQITEKGHQKAFIYSTVFYSDRYSPDSDMDKLITHAFNVDESLFGMPVRFVPREKVLFLYDPEHIIMGADGQKIVLEIPIVEQPRRTQ